MTIIEDTEDKLLYSSTQLKGSWKKRTTELEHMNMPTYFFLPLKSSKFGSPLVEKSLLQSKWQTFLSPLKSNT